MGASQSTPRRAGPGLDGDRARVLGASAAMGGASAPTSQSPPSTGPGASKPGARAPPEDSASGAGGACAQPEGGPDQGGPQPGGAAPAAASAAAAVDGTVLAPALAATSIFRSIADEVAAASLATAAGGAHRPDLVGPPRPPCDPERVVELHRLMNSGGGAAGAASAAAALEDNAPPGPCPWDALTPALGDARTPQVDHIISLLCRLLGSEDAMLALLDGKRVFIRDAAGRTFTPGEFPWRCSFCGWSLASPTPQALIVPDARKDARFAANPFVTGPPGIRFYAGAPVISRAGHRLGTLCIAGMAPRAASAADAATLATLADLVAVELERDAAAAQAAAWSERRLAAATAAASAVVATAPRPSPAALPTTAAEPVGTLLVDTNGGASTDPSLWTVLHVSAAAADALGPPGAAARAATGGGVDGRPPSSHAPPVRLFGDVLRPTAAAPAFAGLAAGDRAFVVRDCAVMVAAGSELQALAPVLVDAAFRPAGRGPPPGLGGEVGVPPRAASSPGSGPTTPGIFTVSLSVRRADTATPRLPTHATHAHAPPSLPAARSLSSLDPVAPAAPIPGLTLGVLVGKGSHGRVFRGALGTACVAVKVISDAVRGVRRTWDGTPMECVLGAGLAHPCLVKTRAWARVKGGAVGLAPLGGGATASDGGMGSGGAWSSGSSGGPATPAGGAEAAAGGVPRSATPLASPPVTSPPSSVSGGDSSSGGSDGLAGVGELPVAAAAAAPPLPPLRAIRTAADTALPTTSAAAAAPFTPAGEPAGEGETWVVLDWCDLGTLQEAIDVGMFRVRPSPIAPPDLRGVHAAAADVAAGLAALHAAGIAHGDLTAHNVLLASLPPVVAAREGRPGPWRAKLADFGLAATVGGRAVDGEDGGEGGGGGGGSVSSTASAPASAPAPYGTITHQPPEVLARGGGPSRPADVYAFGVLLWSLAAGCRPWAGLTFAQVVSAVGLEGRRPRFEALPGPLPAWLVALGEACMDPVSSVRPAMEAVVKRLADVAVAEGWGPPGGGGVWRLPTTTVEELL